jgi:hypothetical protein
MLKGFPKVLKKFTTSCRNVKIKSKREQKSEEKGSS